MRRSDLHYDLPAELIAQHAIEPRDAARLLVLDRATGQLAHRVFREIGDYLRPGDALVLNDTRVLPARFFCRRQTGRRLDALFVHGDADGWRVLLRGVRRVRVGQHVLVENADVTLEFRRYYGRGEWLLRPHPPTPPRVLLEQVGLPPLPPYIRRPPGRLGLPEPADAARYQTVYAAQPGAVAAPTAGLHFTPELLQSIAQSGVQLVRVTLHVGPGTFRPVEVDDLADHPMHPEWYEVRGAELVRLRDVRAAGGRIIAVGTTSVRVLESLPAGALEHAEPCDASGWTRLLIYPPYAFRHVDRLITNFHLPETTLLALVMAFASPEQIRSAYQAAIAERYRLFSYGDAMLIL